MLGTTVTIVAAHDRRWEDAKIVGVGDDTFGLGNPVYIVRHPHFEHDMDFYQKPDEEGKHLNVGNGAFWIVF